MSTAVERLTAAQSKLFVHHRLYPNDASYNLGFIFRIVGPLDVPRLQRVVERILNGARAWNTTFSDADGESPRLVRHDEAADEPRRHRVEIIPVPYGEAGVVARFSEEIDRPIPPEEWPQLRMTIYVSPEGVFYTIRCAHLVGDAFTFYNFIRDVERLYAAPEAACDGSLDPSSFPEPPPDPEAIAHFKDELRGVRAVMADQLACRRTGDGVLRGRRDRVRIDADTAQRLAARIDELKVSRFSFFLAVHALLLSALSGRDQAVVGVPVANRRGPKQRAALGYFVNTLPVAVDLGAHATFADLCRAMVQRVLSLARHQSFDLGASAPKVFEGTQTRLSISSTYTYYKHALELKLPGCTVEPVPFPRAHVMFPFTLNVEDHGDGFTFHVEYADALAPARPVALLQEILRTVAGRPDVPLSEIRAVSPEEERRIDAMVNRRRDDAVAPSLAPSLAAACQAAARRFPERIAVCDDAGRYTYAELDRLSNRVARYLRSLDSGAYVALAMHPSRRLLPVILGILKAGKTYVPLDPKAPEGRTRHIVGQFAELPVIVEPGAFVLTDHPRCIDLACVLTAADEESDAPLDLEDRREETAYVIFTSGSTGKPKGVQVTHANVLRLFTSAEELFDFGPDDTWSLFHSHAFDFSVWEMYGALLYGGRVAVVPDAVRRSPAEFLRFLCDEKVTVLNQTPSAFRQLVSVLDAESAGKLAVRHVVFGGEALYFDVLRPWYERMGDRARLVNMYGITETTVHVTFYPVTAEDVRGEPGSVIGKPLGDLSVHVVDSRLRPCPVGVAGELLVGGAGVSRGYLGADDLTATKFLRGVRPGEVLYRTGDIGFVRPDGNLVYLGRKDKQVQLRGYRIELGEVEAAIFLVPGVRNCVVRMDTQPGIEPRLVAYIVPSDGLDGGERGPSDRDLRTALKRHLPAYMVPSCFVRMHALPLTINGKIDDAALPLPAAAPAATRREGLRSGSGVRSGSGAAAGSDVSGRIAEIWQDVLATSGFGFDDNFFEIGGTSMHVAVVHRRLQERLGAKALRMIDLFEHTTVNALSRHLMDMDGGGK